MKIVSVLSVCLLALVGCNPASGMDVSSLLGDLAHSSYDDAIADISSQIDELQGAVDNAPKRKHHAHNHHSREYPRFIQKRAQAKAQLKRVLAKKLRARLHRPSLAKVDPSLLEMVRQRVGNSEREEGHKYFGHPTHWSEMNDREKILYKNLLPPMPPSQAQLDAKKEAELAKTLSSPVSLLETGAKAQAKEQTLQVADAIPAFSLPNAPAGGNAPDAPGVTQPWKPAAPIYPTDGAPPPAPNQMAEPGSLQTPLPQFLQVPANPQQWRQDTTPLWAPNHLPQYTAAGQQNPVENQAASAQAAAMSMNRFQQMLSVQHGQFGGMQGPMPHFAADPTPPVRESAFGAVLEQNLGQPQSTSRSFRYGAAPSPGVIGQYNNQVQRTNQQTAYPFGAY